MIRLIIILYSHYYLKYQSLNRIESESRWIFIIKGEWYNLWISLTKIELHVDYIFYWNFGHSYTQMDEWSNLPVWSQLNKNISGPVQMFFQMVISEILKCTETFLPGNVIKRLHHLACCAHCDWDKFDALTLRVRPSCSSHNFYIESSRGEPHLGLCSSVFQA